MKTTLPKSTNVMMITKMKVSTVEAIARTLYDFEGLMSRSETEKAIILIFYGQLIVSEQSRVLVNTRDNLLQKLNSIDLMTIKQEQKLTGEQYDELQPKFNDVIEKINRMPLDTCRLARWYYEELVEEVNRYFLNIKRNDMNVEQIIRDIFSRFNRDCNNTISEKMIVSTTLGELLISHYFIIPEEILAEIKSFDINDTKHQLLQVEKKQLTERINKILGNQTIMDTSKKKTTKAEHHVLYKAVKDFCEKGNNDIVCPCCGKKLEFQGNLTSYRITCEDGEC
ncbi:Imm3 family immunity protein [Paenibacillus macerans]|uniref:Imm3 family immunity protein n=1 Tax=Paenibacillus macerans TaxID=44252 RepID=UPI002E1A5AE8|nr:Imm3 family immunity protein [Paenibacillus macerans]